MRTEKICSTTEVIGYGPRSGHTEIIEYKCPCGKGKIVEEHDLIPGFREHSVTIECPKCFTKYKLDLSEGVRGWEIIKKYKS